MAVEVKRDKDSWVVCVDGNVHPKGAGFATHGEARKWVDENLGSSWGGARKGAGRPKGTTRGSKETSLTVRVQTSITKADALSLKKLSALYRITPSELIRRAILAYLKSTRVTPQKGK